MQKYKTLKKSNLFHTHTQKKAAKQEEEYERQAASEEQILYPVPSSAPAGAVSSLCHMLSTYILAGKTPEWI